MKTSKLVLTLIVASFLTAGFSFAAADENADPKPAKCCDKAAKDGKACTHECCADAMKAGDNCEKCGGRGKAEEKK